MNLVWGIPAHSECYWEVSQFFSAKFWQNMRIVEKKICGVVAAWDAVLYEIPQFLISIVLASEYLK